MLILLLLYKISKEKTVVFYCGSGMHMNFSKEWDYDDTSCIGGSEEAVLLLAKEWSRHMKVKIYNERNVTRIYDNGRIVFYPWYTFCPLEKMYIFISWRDPSHFDIFPTINCKYRVLDVHDHIPSAWLSKEACIDLIFTKSKFQAERCVHRDLSPIVRVVPNGIILNSIEVKKEKIILCTSSPERCWIDLFRLAEDLHEIDSSWRVVHAYDYSILKHTKYWETLGELLEKNIYVDVLGHLPLEQTNALYRKSTMFVYPTLFPEIDCVSLTKAIDASCVCVHTSAGAMLEKSKMYNTTCVTVRRNTTYDDGFALNEEE